MEIHRACRSEMKLDLVIVDAASAGTIGANLTISSVPRNLGD